MIQAKGLWTNELQQELEVTASRIRAAQLAQQAYIDHGEEHATIEVADGVPNSEM